MKEQSKPTNETQNQESNLQLTMPNRSVPSAQLPFDIEHFLDIVGDASKRSRQVLLLLLFTSILVLMASINTLSPSFNWNKSRLLMVDNIINYVQLDKSSNQSEGIESLSKFAIENERINGLNVKDSIYWYRNKKYFESLDESFSTRNLIKLIHPKNAPILHEEVDIRKEKYEEIGKSIKYVLEHDIHSFDQVKEKWNKLNEIKTEHFEIVKVPILGISFDINYLGFYSGIVITTLYLLLYFSLFRENVSLKIAFKKGWGTIKSHHYYFYEYVSMLQVLSIPQKLFVPTKEMNILLRAFPYVGLFLPVLIYSWVFFYDCISWKVGSELSFKLTWASLILECSFFLLIIITTYKVLQLWRKMDMFWKYQSYEFNFEYILESIGVDTDLDLIMDKATGSTKSIGLTDLANSILDPTDLEDIKRLWCFYVSKRIETKFYHDISICIQMFKRTTIQSIIAMNIFGSFLDEVLTLSKSREVPEFEPEIIDKRWELLLDWFSSNKRNNTGSKFRSSFYIMFEKANKIQ